MKMKSVLIILATGLTCSWTQAAIISDDFNRADTAFSANPAISIGSDWINGGDSEAQSQILSNAVHSGFAGTNTTLKCVLVNTALETLNEGSQTEFTISAIVQQDHTASTGFAGPVFNYQNNTNFYYLRYSGIGTVQLIRRFNGGDTAALSVVGAFTHVQNRPYKITVSSADAYTFDLSIRDMVTDTVVFSTNAVDTLERFANGLGGLFATSDTVTFDDFSLTSSVISATAVVDNFNRANTTLNTDASVSIGASWLNGGNASSTFGILDNEVDAGANQPFLLLNTDLETLNDGTGTNFTIAGTVKLDTTLGSGLAGLTFNYSNPSNYYAFRYAGNGTVQFLRVVNGTTGAFLSTLGAFTHVQNRPYEITIYSADPHIFDVTIRDTIDNNIVYSNSGVTDGSSHHKNGLGGFYSTTGLTLFDNYYLDSTGAPAPVAGYTQWASTWGVDIGTETNDYDNDGLSNLYEYGLGGNPTNSADQGTSPGFDIVNSGGTNYFGYVHPQLADPDSGISYHLELNTDLVIGTWTNAGYLVMGTNDTGGELDFVTNVTDTVDGHKFIRLIIESL